MNTLLWKGNPMLATALAFTDLFLAALLVGAMFGVWLFFNPKGLDAARYVIVQQQGVCHLNGIMPLLGAATIILTLIAATIARFEILRLSLLVLAAGGFIAAGIITRALNQPINAVVMTWSAAAPPAEWTLMRDRWWRWHQARLVCGLFALGSLILADLLAAI